MFRDSLKSTLLVGNAGPSFLDVSCTVQFIVYTRFLVFFLTGHVRVLPVKCYL